MGRVRLARSAADVLVAIEGTDQFTECVLGLLGCGNNQSCPLHDGWASERAGENAF